MNDHNQYCDQSGQNEVKIPELVVGNDLFCPIAGLVFWGLFTLVCFWLGGEGVVGGAIGVISLIILGPFWIYRIIDNHPKLLIDSNGIQNLRRGHRTIAWEEIQGYTWKRITQNGFACEEGIELVLLGGRIEQINMKHLEKTIEEVTEVIDLGIQEMILKAASEVPRNTRVYLAQPAGDDVVRTTLR